MKIVHKIHLWLSVPCGVLIFILCLSGASLAFEDEITRFAQHDVYYVSDSNGAPLPLSELQSIAESSLPVGVEVKSVERFDDPSRTYKFNLTKPKKGAIFIDPYNGLITGIYERLPFFATTFKLHRWLMDTPAPAGKQFAGRVVVGLTTISFAIIMLTGLILWWPRMLSNPRNAFSIRTSRGWRAFMTTLHTSCGAYASIFLMVMALTGLTWSFAGYRDFACGIFGVDTAKSSPFFYPIHTGGFAGLATRIIWFVAALGGSTLPLTGYYMWLKRIITRSHKQKRQKDVSNP